MKLTNKSQLEEGNVYYIYQVFKLNRKNFRISGIKPIGEYVLGEYNKKTGLTSFISTSDLLCDFSTYHLGKYCIHSDYNEAIEHYNNELDEEIERLNEVYRKSTTYYNSRRH